MRRVVSAAALLAVAVPGVASANGLSYNVGGCVVSVWTPTYTISGVRPTITSTGGYGHSVTCP